MFSLLLAGLLCQIFTVVISSDMGAGQWKLKHIDKCEEANGKFEFEMSMIKINRTHDGINGHFLLDEPVDESLAVRCDVCKMVDGGCKAYQVISENCLINFLNKYAKNNVKSGLEMMGADPPEFPLAPGEYHLEKYIFDYTELPEDAPYGEYGATCYIFKSVLEVGCVFVLLEFREVTYEDEEE